VHGVYLELLRRRGETPERKPGKGFSLRMNPKGEFTIGGTLDHAELLGHLRKFIARLETEPG
jgi:hypothetical protein